MTQKPRPAHRKVHISLPADVYDYVDRESSLGEASFSTTLAKLLRGAIECEEQALLEEALRLDREANLAFSRALAGVNARLLGGHAPTADG